MNRRTLLLAAAASALAACSSKKDLTGAVNDPAVAAPADSVPAARPVIKQLPTSIAMVGDSITAGSKPALEAVLGEMGFTDISINAEKNRRIEIGGKKPMPGLDVVKFIAAQDPPDLWVIALGTNDAGLYSDAADYQKIIDDMLEYIPDELPLVWINTYRDDHLEGCVQFNQVLQDTLKSRGNATVGQWYQQCSKSDQKILSNDGVHPNDDGILVFADTVRAAITDQLN